MALDVRMVRTRLRIITAVSFFVSGIIAGTWSARIPDIQQKFQLNDGHWGLVLFALPAGLFLGLPVSSWIVARFTSYKVMYSSAFVYAAMLCLLPWVRNELLFVPVLFVFGLARTLFNIAINTNSIEVQQFYPKPIIATFHGIWSLACLVAAGIGTLMIWGKVGPAMHFLLMAIVAVLLTVFYKVKRTTRDHLSFQKRPFIVKPDRYLFILGSMAFCTMICEGTMFDWSVNYFDKVIKPGNGFVTAGYASFITTMTLGRFIGDKLVGKFGALKMIMMNGLMIASGFAIAVFFPYTLTACFGFLLIGFGDSILVPVIYSLAGKSTKMLPGYAIASVTMIGYSGFLSGPLIVGSISQAFGMQYAFGLMIFFSLGITLLAMKTPK